MKKLNILSSIYTLSSRWTTPLILLGSLLSFISFSPQEVEAKDSKKNKRPSYFELRRGGISRTQPKSKKQKRGPANFEEESLELGDEGKTNDEKEVNSFGYQWLDSSKKVYVLQNRKYRKGRQILLALGVGATVDSPLVDGYNFQGRISFFFNEILGVEFVGSYNLGEENDTATAVKSAGAIPFRRMVENYWGGMLQWAPFYAKMNTFNKIIYFDWFFGIGGGLLNEEHNKAQLDSNSVLAPLATESHAALLLGTTWRFHITESIGARVDLLSARYRATGPLKGATSSDTSLYSHNDLTLSLDYKF